MSSGRRPKRVRAPAGTLVGWVPSGDGESRVYDSVKHSDDWRDGYGYGFEAGLSAVGKVVATRDADGLRIRSVWRPWWKRLLWRLAQGGS